jgi:trehalose-phosphatase
VVVKSLSQVVAEELPSALESLDTIAQRLDGAHSAVLLDYDGTLTPIVSRPEDAELAEPMREMIRNLSECCTVGIITGRDMEVIQELVGLKHLVYATGHGFEIALPNGQVIHPRCVGEFLAAIDGAESMLRSRLADIEGVLLERKRFSVAVHYRTVLPQRQDHVTGIVDDVLIDLQQLRRLDGKKVYEILPQLQWHKGKAIRWVMGSLGIKPTKLLYIGDDITDEDVFCEIRGQGMGILVRDGARSTAASYCLGDQREVQPFLQGLIERLTSYRRGT